MVTLNARFDGRVFVPEGPVDMARGTKCRITVQPAEEPEEKGLPLVDFALECARKMKGDYPTDLARNHDHYLHGRPKRP